MTLITQVQSRPGNEGQDVLDNTENHGRGQCHRKVPRGAGKIECDNIVNQRHYHREYQTADRDPGRKNGPPKAPPIPKMVKDAKEMRESESA